MCAWISPTDSPLGGGGGGAEQIWAVKWCGRLHPGPKRPVEEWVWVVLAWVPWSFSSQRMALLLSPLHFVQSTSLATNKTNFTVQPPSPPFTEISLCLLLLRVLLCCVAQQQPSGKYQTRCVHGAGTGARVHTGIIAICHCINGPGHCSVLWMCIVAVVATPASGLAPFIHVSHYT